jgi:hypothetical protein
MKNKLPLHLQPLPKACEALQRREYQREPKSALPDWAPQGYVDCSYWPDEVVESAVEEVDTFEAAAA